MSPIFECYFNKTISKISPPYPNGKLSRDDFVVLYASLFGFRPSREEIEAVFKNNESRELRAIRRFLDLRFASIKNIDLHMLELFKVLDKESKGYITCQDLIDLETKEYSLPKMFVDYFTNVTPEKTTLDYFDFKKVYLRVNKDLWVD